MKVFFDTNVLLDVLLAREPFVADSQRAWLLAEQGKITGMISALSLPTIYYLARRSADRDAALAMVRQIRSVFAIVACDEAVVDRALVADMPDFEDAIQFFSAQAAGATCVLTRDGGHYPTATLPVLSPAQFLATRP